MHKSAYADAEKFVAEHLQGLESLRVLDVGSYNVNGTLRPLFERPGWTYVGADISAGPNVDLVIPDPYDWRSIIADSSFDVVVSSQTLEHVPKPWRWFPELARVCSPGGLVYVCTPNTIHYHPYPVDCWRCWPDGMRALLEDAGLLEIACYRSGMDTTGIGRKPA